MNWDQSVELPSSGLVNVTVAVSDPSVVVAIPTHASPSVIAPVVASIYAGRAIR
jgi:hypothetical protein